MRIAVLGAGAVGGTLAALLSREGHEVLVTARGEHLAALQQHGLHVDGGFGEIEARVVAHATLAARPEFAILTTKAQDAAATLADNAQLLEGVPVLVVQNGIGGLEAARSALPHSPVLGGLALFAASYLSPGRVTVTAAAPILVGASEGADPSLARMIAKALGTRIRVEVSDDIVAAQWTKLLVNHVNALPAITGLSVQDVVAHPSTRRIMAASMRETVRIVHARGGKFGDLPGIRGWLVALIGSLPLALGAVFPRTLARRMGSVPNPGSTLQSIRRGRPTEIDFLNGAVVALAEPIGRTAPINAALTALVHEVEASGEFLTPGQLSARVAV